jgi:hypothetical protein
MARRVMTVPPCTVSVPVDVDRELSAQYLAAVVRDLDQRGLPVATTVLHEPAETGGTVIFVVPADAPADQWLPLSARWDGGGSWTLMIGRRAPRGRTKHAHLHRRHTPPPVEVAEFVAAPPRSRFRAT